MPSLPLGGLNAKNPDVALLHNDEPLHNFSTTLPYLCSSSLQFAITQVRIIHTSNNGTQELDTGKLHGTYNLLEECLEHLQSYDSRYCTMQQNARTHAVALGERRGVHI